MFVSGEYADIHLNAYPDRALKGRISNILPILDPNLRTAKVRLEVENPGTDAARHVRDRDVLRQDRNPHATVPATAILHLHDREWVYTPMGDGHFRRMEVVGGNMLPGNMQEIMSGHPARRSRWSRTPWCFQNTVEQ